MVARKYDIYFRLLIRISSRVTREARDVANSALLGGGGGAGVPGS